MPFNLERDLNDAQREAVITTQGPVLVIAGAGSGKTRTIVYRLAHLVELGVYPEHILLLTFTRKAAQEMLTRAQFLLGGQALADGPHGVNADIRRVTGGTFHSFAFATLRRAAAARGEAPFSIMDSADATDILAQAKTDLGVGKGDRSFPKKNKLLEVISKSRNKEKGVADVLAEEAAHLVPYAEDLGRIAVRYAELKTQYGLYDYDDLLFALENLLLTDAEAAARARHRHRYLMVDEFQDTNLVQARLVRLLAGGDAQNPPNVMAVGDDAQSIYGFRGANVANIFNFPDDYPGTKVIRLERNYRSTQPILDVGNAILENARTRFDKKLYTDRTGTTPVKIVRTFSDQSQARIAVQQVTTLSKKYDLSQIAVLFRAGYQSYGVELELNRLGIGYAKFGGIRFTEAAHIKDVLAYLRIVANPGDLPAWQRALGHIKGIGPKTALTVYRNITGGEVKKLEKQKTRFPDLPAALAKLDGIRERAPAPAEVIAQVMEYLQPKLPELYPDDYPRRQQGIEQLGKIASTYDTLETFLADVSLENPESDNREVDQDKLVLSTIHSAKGLEFKAVLILDLVEDRFPSRRAQLSADDMEEERRLMYVAATRAMDELQLYVPETVYNRTHAMNEPVRPSPFVLEVTDVDHVELRESYAGGLTEQERRAGGAAQHPAEAGLDEQAASPSTPTVTMGYVTHRIFGRGKVIEDLGGGKVRVNFAGFGVKTMLAEYLTPE